MFEEEDFQTLTYGFKFKSNVTELRVIGMLREVEDDVNRTIRVGIFMFLNLGLCVSLTTPVQNTFFLFYLQMFLRLCLLSVPPQAQDCLASLGKISIPTSQRPINWQPVALEFLALWCDFFLPFELYLCSATTNKLKAGDISKKNARLLDPKTVASGNLD